jgi:hypothetical protein
MRTPSHWMQFTTHTRVICLPRCLPLPSPTTLQSTLPPTTCRPRWWAAPRRSTATCACRASLTSRSASTRRARCTRSSSATCAWCVWACRNSLERRLGLRRRQGRTRRSVRRTHTHSHCRLTHSRSLLSHTPHLRSAGRRRVGQVLALHPPDGPRRVQHHARVRAADAPQRDAAGRGGRRAQAEPGVHHGGDRARDRGPRRGGQELRHHPGARGPGGVHPRDERAAERDQRAAGARCVGTAA